MGTMHKGGWDFEARRDMDVEDEMQREGLDRL